jgi:hypothetical protein
MFSPREDCINVSRASSAISQKTSRAERPDSQEHYIYECQISCIIYETCIFVLLVDEYYIIMNLQMASIVH